jgi:hypothetical protein
MTRRHGPLVKGSKCIRRRWEEDEAKKSGKRNRSNINRKVGVPVIPFWSNILAGALHNDVFFSCITNGNLKMMTDKGTLAIHNYSRF